MRVTMLMVIMMMIDEMRAGGHQPPSGRGHILFAGWNRHPLLSFIAIVINGKIYLRHASFIIHQKNTSNIIITVSIIIKGKTSSTLLSYLELCYLDSSIELKSQYRQLQCGWLWNGAQQKGEALISFPRCNHILSLLDFHSSKHFRSSAS